MSNTKTKKLEYDSSVEGNIKRHTIKLEFIRKARQLASLREEKDSSVLVSSIDKDIEAAEAGCEKLVQTYATDHIYSRMASHAPEKYEKLLRFKIKEEGFYDLISALQHRIAQFILWKEAKLDPYGECNAVALKTKFLTEHNFREAFINLTEVLDDLFAQENLFFRHWKTSSWGSDSLDCDQICFKEICCFLAEDREREKEK